MMITFLNLVTELHLIKKEPQKLKKKKAASVEEIWLTRIKK